jgi:hypothetical protein
MALTFQLEDSKYLIILKEISSGKSTILTDVASSVAFHGDRLLHIEVSDLGMYRRVVATSLRTSK